MTDNDLVPSIQPLIEEFARSGLMTLHVRSAAIEILLSNDLDAGVTQSGPLVAAAPVPTSAPAPQPASRPVAASPGSSGGGGVDTAELPAGAVIVRAPNLGTFYRAPKPGAENYVQVGSTVSVGQEICLIEVMKLFTAVRAELAGRIHAVLADDGAMVEAGQPLFALVAN